MQSIDHLLESWNTGSETARDELAEVIYPELRRLAAARLARWSGDVSIQATELAHEAYFKLIEQNRVTWHNKTQLFAVLSRLIRRLLVDHSRHRSRQKRGGAEQAITLDAGLLAESSGSVDFVDLDAALDELATIDETAVQVVEVLFFAGLTHDEAAPALGLGRATVGRKWRFARAWLASRLAS